MSEAIRLVDQLQPGDMISFNALLRTRIVTEVRTSLRYWLSAIALVALLLAVTYLTVQQLPRYTGRTFAYLEFHVGAGITLLAAFGAFLLARRQTAKAIRARAASPDAGIYGPRTLIFDSNRVEVLFSNSGSWRTWSEFVSIAEYEALVVLWRTETDGMIISKRAFGGATDVSAFLTVAGSWIASAKQARHT